MNENSTTEMELGNTNNKNNELTSLIRPAIVKLITGDRLLVDDGKSTSWATMALAYPYDAKIGDRLLVACSPDSWYIIGVLNVSDTLTIATRGDIKFQARGNIRLTAQGGVGIDSPAIHIQSEEFSTVADSAFQRFGTLRTSVTKLFSVSAGEFRKLIKGRYRLKANRIVEKAKEDVNIDGKRINLG